MSPGWRESKKLQLRETLYETSIRLLGAHGFERTTVGRVADEAGVAKGTFFNHFASKEEVLTEWYRRLTRDALAETGAADHATAQDALTALALALARRTESDAHLWDMKTLQATARTRLLEEEERLDRELAGFCARWIDEARARGEVDPDLDTASFVDLFIAVLTGTGHNWVVADHAFDLSAVLRHRIAFLFRAARPR